MANLYFLASIQQLDPAFRHKRYGCGVMMVRDNIQQFNRLFFTAFFHRVHIYPPVIHRHLLNRCFMLLKNPISTKITGMPFDNGITGLIKNLKTNCPVRLLQPSKNRSANG